VVATPKKSHGKTENNPALPTTKKMQRKDVRTGSAAHTLRVEDGTYREVLGRASGMKSAITLGKGPRKEETFSRST
jgi:hypothetical protein